MKVIPSLVERLKARGLTNAEIGRRLGISRARVGQIVKRIRLGATKPTDADVQVADVFLNPIIAHVSSTKGAIAKMTDELTRRTGGEARAGQVRRWLDPDIKKRHACRLGIGLLMMEIWKDWQNANDSSR